MAPYLLQVDLMYHSTVQVALMFAAFLITLTYMFGSAMSMPSLKGFARNELTELGVTMIILIIAILLIQPGGIFDQVASGFAVQSPGGLKFCEDWIAQHPYDPATGSYKNGNLAFGQADYFLGCRPKFGDLFPPWNAAAYLGSDRGGIMLSKLTNAYGKLEANELFFSLFGNLNLGLMFPILGAFRIDLHVSGVPFIFMNLLVEMLTVLVDTIGTLMGAFIAQKMLLNFIEETMLMYILPLGLLFRAFPFSRKTGSTIVAVVFAAYFIYPISILINYQMYNMVQNPQGAPGCFVEGDACSADSQCCSNDCRGECVAPLTDFREYESVFTMCEGKTPAEIDNSMRNLAQEQIDYQTDVLENRIESTEKGSKAQSRLETGFDEQQRLSGLDYMGGTLAWPFEKAVQVSFTLFESWVGDIGKLLVMTALFVVVEIVITLTLMKDFALLIGGEPRLLGMGKLV